MAPELDKAHRRFQVQHKTRYRYREAVSFSRNLALLLPRPLAYQQIHSSGLDVDPMPEPPRELRDGLGNRLYDFTVTQPHSHFTVNLHLDLTIYARIWKEGCDSLRSALARLEDIGNNGNMEAAMFRYATRHVEWSETIHELTEPIIRHDMPPHAAARHLMETIHREWKFQAGVTHLHTSVEDLLQRRQGVCQDFTHLMLAALRSVGIPARYVSGYLETLPKPGRPKLVGADVSHAWVQAYDPIAGWKDFDPTNNLIPGVQHITLAFGRDFADISPLRGLVSGGGEQQLQVSVDVSSLDA